MKKLLMISSMFLCLAGAQAFGQANAVVTVTSDYMWRGVSFNSYSTPAVQGDLSYGLGHGLTLGAWASNISGDAYQNTYGGYEFDPYLTYTHEMDGMSVYATAQWITYIRAPKYNTMEYTLGINWNGINASISHQPDFFGWGVAYNYFQANYGMNLHENLWVVGTYGYHDIDGYTDAFGREDLAHAKLALQLRKEKSTFELAFSKTFDSKSNATKGPAVNGGPVLYSDEATIVSWTTNL